MHGQYSSSLNVGVVAAEGSHIGAVLLALVLENESVGSVVRVDVRVYAGRAGGREWGGSKGRRVLVV